MIFPVDDIDSGNVQCFTAREISELEILTYMYIYFAFDQEFSGKK